MPDPIRIVHFSDLHIGMENYGRLDPQTGLNGRVVDFLTRLDGVVSFARDHDADVVLFAGDAFRSRSPGTTLQRELAQRIRALSEAGIAVVLLVGNHDVPVVSQRASSVEIFDTLAVPHVVVAQTPAVHRIQTRRGLLQVLALPYPLRQRLLTKDQFRSLPQSELDHLVSQVLVASSRILLAPWTTPLLRLCSVTSPLMGARWGSERSIMVGRDVTLPLSALVDSRWQYVALGHIHEHQDLNPGSSPPVVYAGSLERVDFGEERQPKGFCWVLVDRDHVSWDFVQVNARRFVTIRTDVRGEANPLGLIQHAVQNADLAGSVVRLIIHMSREQEPTVRDADLMPLLSEPSMPR